MPARRSRGAACLPLLGALTALAGCGGPDDREVTAQPASGPLGEGGTIVWAVADRVETIDPLTADTRAEQLVSRQVHEPLVADLTGPFGDPRRVPGLARRIRPSSNATIWTLRLRTGVRFQDGAPFNARAAVVNVERWRTTAAGQAALPGVVEAFAPRPDQLRFILAAPDPRFDERLAEPGLGVVSPRALRPRSGTGARFARATLDTGTGPFVLAERSRNRQLLAHNTGWWGATSNIDLGPALERVEFRTESAGAVRLALLDAGDAQVAGELNREQADIARSDPLLTAIRGQGRSWLGLSRAVRGIDSAREIPSLSGAWLTTLGAAG